jgi:hypothetical protein
MRFHLLTHEMPSDNSTAKNVASPDEATIHRPVMFLVSGADA